MNPLLLEPDKGRPDYRNKTLPAETGYSLADPLTVPQKQAKVVALTLPVQNPRHSVSYDLPRVEEKMAEL